MSFLYHYMYMSKGNPIIVIFIVLHSEKILILIEELLFKNSPLTWNTFSHSLATFARWAHFIGVKITKGKLFSEFLTQFNSFTLHNTSERKKNTNDVRACKTASAGTTFALCSIKNASTYLCFSSKRKSGLSFD